MSEKYRIAVLKSAKIPFFGPRESNCTKEMRSVERIIQSCSYAQIYFFKQNINPEKPDGSFFIYHWYNWR